MWQSPAKSTKIGPLGGSPMTTPANWCLAVVATVLAVMVGVTTASFAQDAASRDTVSLRGAGSTFSAPLYRRWIQEYAASHPQVSISYDVVGSGEGIQRFLTDAVDFAGSDEILSDSESAKAGGAIMVPVTAGMVVLAYNIPGVTGEIRFPRDVYLDIFAGGIRRWDDARIKAANPGVALPHRDIVLVARQDGSGTTAAFTRHLDVMGPSWRGKGMAVGKLIDWPKGTLLAPGNEGVAAQVKATEGAIGYVEFWYARRFGLKTAALQNRAGRFISPNVAAGDLALSGRVAQVRQLDASVADPATPGAYPIPSYSWMLLYPHYLDRSKAAALRDFVEWGLGQQAQDSAAELGYLSLPADVIGLGKRTLMGLTY
jgi:phosphate transport system substrate-binding protein